jgi:hypothetical protein
VLPYEVRMRTVFTKSLFTALSLLALSGCKPEGGFGDIVGVVGGGSSTSSCSPTVLAVTPYVIAPSGGSTFSVSGSCFKAGLKVYFQGSAATNVVLVDANTATGIAPASAAYGSATVVVLNTDQSSGNLPNGAFYQGPPSVSSVTPAAGSLSGGNTVTVLGSGFSAGATVTFGSATPQVMSVISAAQGSVTLPAGAAGTVNVRVTNPDGQSSTLANGYTYQPAPVVSTISPSSGPNTGGTTVTIYGLGFISGATVTIGGSSCSSVGVAANGLSLTCTTSPMTSGVADVKVTNSDGQFGTLSNGFTYTGASSPPTLVSVTPTSGTAAGGTSITISGTNFVSGATVSIGGTSASISSVSPTSIVAVTSAKTAGTYNLVVTNPDTQTATLGNAYTYNNPPVLSSVSPAGGPLAGGNTVTLVGANFNSMAAITIGSGSCTSVLANSTTATCTAPAGSSGAKTVTITNPDGTSSSLTNAYSYNPAPTVSSIAPNAGRLTAGVLATISGSNFQAGATVSVGGVATAVTATSATSLFVTLPANSAGQKNIVVTNPDTQTGTLVNGYTYQGAPTISSISPASGALGGGTAVTLTGTGFLSAATVSIGSAPLSGITVVSSTSITGFTTSSTSGAKDVVVTNTDSQVGTLTNGYTYSAGPSVASSSPAAGPLAGGTTVTVVGTGFANPMTVQVNGVAGTSVNVTSPTTLSFVTPTNVAGTYSIVVTDSFSQSATLSNAFSYYPAPTVTSISPTAGPLAGGTAITITGTGFRSGATVSVGGVPITVGSVGSTSITGTTAANSAGSYSAVVTNTDSQSGTGGSFSHRPVPTVTSISPTSGTTAGGTTVTITGTNFYSAITATIGAVTCTSPTFVNSTTMTCVTGFNPAGLATVVVTNNPDVQSGTGTNLFTYRSPPILSSVTPSTGFIGGENTITLSGSGFASGATVTIDGTACTNVVVGSATSATCKTPAGSITGAKNVVLTNSDTQSSTLTNGFTYANDYFTVVDQFLGNGSPQGYLDGTGSAVRLNNPAGIATDSSGNVYTIENTNCTLRKITSSGVVTTLAGIPGSCTLSDGPGTSARFRWPIGMVIDSSGNNLYVAEWGAIRVVSLLSPYTVTTLAGSGTVQGLTNGTGGAARFWNPRALTIDSTDTHLYVADMSNCAIRNIVISTGVVTTLAGGTGCGSNDNATGTLARFNQPAGIAWTSGNLLYVADRSNHTVRLITLGGTNPVTTVVGVAGAAGGTEATGTAARLYSPNGLYWDGSTNLYLSDGNSATIRQITLPGYVVTTVWGTYNSTGTSDDVYNAARFNFPIHITGDASRLYVADYGNHIVRQINLASGEVETIAGVPNSYGYTDGTQSVSKFNGPRGMSVVGGVLYLTEWNNCLIRATNLSSVTTSTFAGQVGTCTGQDGSGTFSARLSRSAAMATDGTNLFVADTQAHSVRRVTVSSASVNTISGSNGTLGTATGTGTTGRYNNPQGIAVSGTDVFIADTSNHVIRRVVSSTSPTNGGVMQTFAGLVSTAGWLDGTGSSVRFNNPTGITAMGANLYVADQSNCVIRQIVIATGVVSTIAGSPGSCSFADGSGALARFSSPYGITNDGTNLYVADVNNHAVRKISMPGAVVTTLFGDPASPLDNNGGPLAGSNVRSPTGIFWSTWGLFVANDFGVKRLH